MRMKHEQIDAKRRRATNVTLPPGLVDEAKALKISVSQACEAGLQRAVTEEADRQWQVENADWIKAHNAWVEANELPLERYRLF